MKKLMILIFLGVVFFIGGQWLGLSMADRSQNNPTEEAQDSSASDGVEIKK